MRLLLDTCVVSEANKPQAAPELRDWLAAQQFQHTHISALTLGELSYGAARLPGARRKHDLVQWIETVRQDFDGRILPFDTAVALHWGQLRAAFKNVQLIDSQIAATALVHGLTLVTRNVKDFRYPGLAVFNPWSK